MKTREDALAFAKASADSAFAMQSYYSDLQDAIDSNRENIRCTLQEYDLVEFEYEAFDAYDKAIEKIRSGGR